MRGKAVVSPSSAPTWLCSNSIAMEASILVSVITILLALGRGAHAFVCPKYIFVFGDSLTDPGNTQVESPLSLLLTAYPYGISYRFPDRPCERTRFCDGRLNIDYIAQAFGFPFLEPYSRLFQDSSYSHGINFAYSGATAQFSLIPFPTFYLGREVDNYFFFRARFSGDVNVSTALHLIPEIGGNDFTYAFIGGLSIAAANSGLSDQVLAATKQNIERLHAGGARFFYIFNQPPIGCTPFYLTTFSGMSPKDEYGCLSAYNDLLQNYNAKLKAAVYAYRVQWPDTIILLFDWYAATIEIIRNEAIYGIKTDGFRACCGGGGTYNYNPLVSCGLLATVCPDPEHNLFWDGIHYTEGTNRQITKFALTGRFVDGPPEAVNLKAACNLDFSAFSTTIPNPQRLVCP